MLKSDANAFAIIFPNSYDSLVPDLASERLMASIPFAARYRLCDFMISSMVHSGIDNISFIARENYHSLMDHLGSGREWDLVRKNGGLNIIPPFAQKSIKIYNGSIEALESIKGFIKNQTEKYVILTDSNCAFNFDFKKLLKSHIESHADVSAVYCKREIPEVFSDPMYSINELYYTFEIEDNRIQKIFINPKDKGITNFCMNIFILEREHLIELIEDAYVQGYRNFTRDILRPLVDALDIHAFCYEGYVAHIFDMQTYFDENMKLLDVKNRNELFDGPLVYTKIRDDHPTRYVKGSKTKNIMAADGCIIEGEVENSILFRGVKVGKGAVVKNCILMQDTVIGDGARLEYVITDKQVAISEGKVLIGDKTFPVFVDKRKHV